MRHLVILFCLAVWLVPPACAYPEFQAFIEKRSGRTVNCAMCHASGDGPVGDGEGQLGSLKPEQLEQVNKARAAIEAGVDVDSPIMNEFGNHIIKSIGMKKVLEAKSNPELLAKYLENKGDLDDDGIADAQEILDGTDSMNKFHGDAYRLFMVNIGRQKFHLLMAFFATVLLIFGFSSLIKALNIITEKKTK